MRRSGRLVVVAALVVLVVATGCDWEQFGNGAGNARASEDNGIALATASTLTRVWTAAGGGEAGASAAISHGVVYGASGGWLVANDASAPASLCEGEPRSCARLWYGVVTAGAANTMTSPAVSDGVVVAGSTSGAIAAFDAAGVVGCHGLHAACDPLWTAQVAKPAGSPTVFEGRVYVGTGTGLAVFDLDGHDGCAGAPVTCAPLWTAPTSVAATGVAIADGHAYTGADRVYAFDALGTTGCTGSPKICAPTWTSAPIAGLGAPAISDHVLYVPAATRVYAFDDDGGSSCTGAPLTCAPRWSGTAYSPHALAVAKGRVYAAGTKIAVLDAAGIQGCSGSPVTCTPLWTTATRVVAPAAPAVANGLLYAPTADRALSVYDATGTAGCAGTPKVCRPLRSATLRSASSASPAVAQGVVYLGGGEGLEAWRPTPYVRPSCAANPHAGLGPCQIQDAYRLPATTNGRNRVIAIVDAYDNPNAAADLAVYRAEYGLPPCTVANGCFRKVNQRGDPGGATTTDAGWGLEIALDLDMVSAACPLCRIVLVEADSASAADLSAAAKTAIGLAPNAVSNSYGGPEDPSQTSLDASFKGNGIPVVVSTGDDGYGVNFPASSPNVIAVGGTELVADPSTSRGWSETAWAGAGSGCSAYEKKPTWQTDTGCARRTVADVSAIAGSPGLAVYDTFGGVPGWVTVGGTSASAPIVAAGYGLAPTIGGAAELWRSASRFDIVSGSNGSCAGSYLCTAGPGFDGPTGIGSPCGTGAFSFVDARSADCATTATGASLRAHDTPRPAPVTLAPVCPPAPPGRLRCFAWRVEAP
jgi:hypothetical protein